MFAPFKQIGPDLECRAAGFRVYGRGMDRVDLAWEYGRTGHGRWHLRDVPYWQEEHVSLGQLADGRWYADHTRIPGGAYVGGEAEVRAVVDDWLTDGRTWVEA